MIEKSIYQIAEKISKLYQEAYDVYLPLVEDVCSREVSEEEMLYLLDYLLDFTCNEKNWVCIKKFAEGICIHIQAASNFILKRIGTCGKKNDYSAEFLKAKMFGKIVI